MTQIKAVSCTDRAFLSFLPRPDQLIRNTKLIALPAIALFVASTLQTASSGPISWGICIVACETVAASATAATAGAAAASLIACVKACQPVLYAPFCP